MKEFVELAILVGFAVAVTGSLIAAVAHFAVTGQGPREHLKQATAVAEDKSSDAGSVSRVLQMSGEAAGQRP